MYFERETETETERQSISGRRTERGRERIPSRLCTDSTEPDVGLDPTNHEITTRAGIEIEAYLTKPPRRLCNSSIKYEPSVRLK